MDINIKDEDLRGIAENLISGSVINDRMVDCIHGLLLDDSSAAARIISSMLGSVPDYSNGMKPGDVVLIGKGKYFMSDYDIDASVDAACCIVNKDSSSYTTVYLIARIIEIFKFTESKTFKVSYKLVDSAGKSKELQETVSCNHIKPFIQDGEDQQIHVL
jgi:hypothetical protein